MRDEDDRAAARRAAPRTTSCRLSTSVADRLADGSSRTMRSASRASARRISTCCCLASGRLPDDGVRPEVEPGVRDEPVEPLAQRAAIDEAGAPRLGAEEHVLGHGQPRDERDLLGDERDPADERLARRPERDRRPPQDQVALILREDAGDDLAQGGLAGPVLADERVDRARPDGDRDIVEGPGRPEGLPEPADLEMDGAVGLLAVSRRPTGSDVSPATPRAAGRYRRWPWSRRHRPAAWRAGRRPGPACRTGWRRSGSSCRGRPRSPASA